MSYPPWTNLPPLDGYTHPGSMLFLKHHIYLRSVLLSLVDYNHHAFFIPGRSHPLLIMPLNVHTHPGSCPECPNTIWIMPLAMEIPIPTLDYTSGPARAHPPWILPLVLNNRTHPGGLLGHESHNDPVCLTREVLDDCTHPGGLVRHGSLSWPSVSYPLMRIIHGPTC